MPSLCARVVAVAAVVAGLACLAHAAPRALPPNSLVPSFVPPRQTAAQQEVVEGVTPRAAEASAMARRDVLAFLDTPEFRENLTACCPSVASLPAQDLLQAFMAEVRVSELVHNVMKPGWLSDPPFDLLANTTFFPNAWESMVLGLMPMTPSPVEDSAEQGLYGFPPFSGNFTPGSMDEAMQRPMYTAWNLQRLSTGNPDFGNLAYVFSPSYVRDATVVAAVDTGLYEMSCNASLNHSRPFPLNVSCSAWDGTPGTLDFYLHLLLPNLGFWNTTEPLFLAFARAFGGDNAPVVPHSLRITYLEADIAGNVLYPEGIKMLVASFNGLFGTPNATLVRQYCQKHGWALTWAYSGIDRIGATRREDLFVVGDGASDNATAIALHRVVDPHVASYTSLNYTRSDDFVLHFDTLWAKVQAERQVNPDIDWQGLWDSFLADAPNPSRLRFLNAASCADPDPCLGVDGNGACLCYQS